MPIYDFKCAKCDFKFERFTSISQRDAVACPKCGGKVTRVFEGKWSMGIKSGQSSGGCSCGGNCAGCSGCGN